MREWAFVILFCAVVILGSLGTAAWLVASGQALTLDGLFLVLVCLALAAVFAIYLASEIKRALAAAQPAPAAAAKPVSSQARPATPGAPPTEEKPVPVTR